MAKTIIERNFWNDEQIIDEYSPEDKLFMIYLLTCPRGNAIGIFKLPIKIMAFEIGYSIDSIKALIDRFMNKYNRINYDYDNQEIAIHGALKYNISKGGKPIEDMVSRELKSVVCINNLEIAYKSMIELWSKSERTIDKTIKTLFENEISKRKENTYTNTYTNTNTDTPHVSYDVSDNVSEKDNYIKKIIDEWNKIPELENISNREKDVEVIISNYGVKNTLKVIDNIKYSKFLRGMTNNSTWKVSLKWIIPKKNFEKILENGFSRDMTDFEVQKIEDEQALLKQFPKPIIAKQ